MPDFPGSTRTTEALPMLETQPRDRPSDTPGDDLPESVEPGAPDAEQAWYARPLSRKAFVGALVLMTLFGLAMRPLPPCTTSSVSWLLASSLPRATASGFVSNTFDARPASERFTAQPREWGTTW